MGSKMKRVSPESGETLEYLAHFDLDQNLTVYFAEKVVPGAFT
jgi:hypothetical protein